MLAALIAIPFIAGGDAPGTAQRWPDSVPDALPFVLTRMEVDLQLDYAARAIRGSATLHFRNISSAPATTVPLLLGRLMHVSAITTGVDTIPTVARVVVFADDSARQVNAIEAQLPSPVAAGDSVVLRVSYGGILVGYTETGSRYIRDHVSPEFTILRTDAYAFPHLGVGSHRVNREVREDAFHFSARITVPLGQTVATGGAHVQLVRRDSLQSWYYRSVEPVPFLNIAVAPYRVLEREGATIFHFPADSAGAQMVAGAVDAAMARYRALYGPLTHAPRLTVIEIPEGFGSQASLTAGIIQTADAFRDRAQLRQLYHELSHLWNVPDRERPSPRWNEGLATFLQWRLAVELDGGLPLRTHTERIIQSLLRRCETSARCATIPMASYGAAGATDLSYSVGMLMFDALYEVMGADAFDRTYRAFFEAHRVSGASTPDLVAAFRRADRRAGRIFNDWLSTTRWYDRLQAGESFSAMITDYAR